jgi:tetratricopeptide (TPR) repeat protein
MLTLRTAIGLTQEGLAKHLGISRQAVGKWEAGSMYPKAEHLKEVIALGVQAQAFPKGSEAEEIRALWKAARQKRRLDERWLSVLLSRQGCPLPHVAWEETMTRMPATARSDALRGTYAGNEYTEAFHANDCKHPSFPVQDRSALSVGTGHAPCPVPKARDHAREEERSLKKSPTTFNQTPAQILAPDQATPVIQNLPFSPNPFFTGRESELGLLSHLFEQCTRIALTQPLSISGLGGIGKTQLALEYAHRCYPHIYQCVFFVNAADKATLEAGYLSLAHLLQLPEKNEREVDRIVQAVKIWLEEHPRWLLILDNADDLELARSYLPTRPRGHILLTTRSQIVGQIATLVQVEAMPPEVGLLFLLRRSGVNLSANERDTVASDILHEACLLVEMLAGHPLALDQAGAYIEETRDPEVSATGGSFREYKQLYQQQCRHLLKNRGSFAGEHPESVALTLEISMQKACELHPSCADILSFCSLLHPDAIPEELLCHEIALNLPLLHFNEAIVALRRYSLIKRDAQMRVLSVHRLVQAVSRDLMESQTLRQWRERVIRAVNAVFPEAEFEQWSRCEQLLPHVQLLATWVEREAIAPAEAGHLLRKAGNYLRERVQYTDAEPLHKLALAIREQHLGANHPDTAKSLNNLAILYSDQGKYEQAESLYQRAFTILEQHLGADHPDTATSLNNLAFLYWRQGKYEQAEPLYQRVLQIRERHLGASHPGTAMVLNNLAILYWRQGKYEQAEPLYQRALAIREQHLGASHPDTARTLNNLAILYRSQGKYEQAEPLYQRALAIEERHLGADHPSTASTLHNLAGLYRKQGRYEQAEPLYQRVLQVLEQCLGVEHPDTADSLYELAELYRQQGKYEQAEPLYQRALQIREQHLGASHPDTAESLHGLAELYQHQGKDEQAEALYQRALRIREHRLGATHPETENTRRAYAAFQRLVEHDEKGTVLDVDHQPPAEECNRDCRNQAP